MFGVLRKCLRQKQRRKTPSCDDAVILGLFSLKTKKRYLLKHLACRRPFLQLLPEGLFLFRQLVPDLPDEPGTRRQRYGNNHPEQRCLLCGKMFDNGTLLSLCFCPSTSLSPCLPVSFSCVGRTMISLTFGLSGDVRAARPPEVGAIPPGHRVLLAQRTYGTNVNGDGYATPVFRSHSVTMENKKTLRRVDGVKCRRGENIWLSCNVARVVFP